MWSKIIKFYISVRMYRCILLSPFYTYVIINLILAWLRCIQTLQFKKLLWLHQVDEQVTYGDEQTQRQRSALCSYFNVEKVIET